MSRGLVLRNPATCCASVETGSVSTASNTTCPATPASYTRLLHLPATTIPASPASTIPSYNRFLAFSMTAPPPEKSSAGGYRPAGLRRAPEWARLPAGCCLCDRCCPKDGDTKTLSLRGTKKAAGEAAFLCERRDSNPYAQRHQILSLAWLPITTRSQNPSEGL